MSSYSDQRLEALTRLLLEALQQFDLNADEAGVRLAITALSSAMAYVLVQLGPEGFPFVETICQELGGEMMRQVREAHAEHALVEVQEKARH